MRSTIARAAAVCLLGLLSSTGFARAPDPGAGARLAGACAACHGPGGHSRGAIPSLAGLPVERFVARMRAYKRADDRSIMARIAPAYDAAEIRALARFYAARETPGASETAR